MTEVMGGASKLLVINSANPPNHKRLDIWTPLRPLPFVPPGKEEGQAAEGKAEAATSVAQEVLDSLLPGSSTAVEGGGASGDGSSSGGSGGEGGEAGGERGGKKALVGRYLSSSDVQDMADFAAELAVKHVIPHLERKVRDLNQQVCTLCRGGEGDGAVGGWVGVPREGDNVPFPDSLLRPLKLG